MLQNRSASYRVLFSVEKRTVDLALSSFYREPPLVQVKNMAPRTCKKNVMLIPTDNEVDHV